jgi:phenylalanyl-tRNA synthetase beta subunit
MLNQNWHWQPPYEPLSKFPAHEQDITFEVPKDVSYQELTQNFESLLQESYKVQSFECLSIYQKSKSIGKRNISYRMRLQSDDQTLKTNEVNLTLDRITVKISKSLSVNRVVK